MKRFFTAAVLLAIIAAFCLACACGGCRTPAAYDHSADAGNMVGGGSIDHATGRVTVGGCVTMEVRPK